MPEPRPYPLSAVPRFTRAEASRLRSIVHGRPLEALLDAREGCGWSVTLGGPPRLSGPRGEAIARPSLLLERSDGARAWLELDPAIAGALVDRTLGGEGTDAPAAAPLDDFAVGILCYAIASGLSTAAGWRVLAAFAYDAAPRAALECERLLGFPLRLTTGDRSGDATLWFGAFPQRSTHLTERLPQWSLGLRTPACVIAGRAQVPLARWRTAARGDALMPDRLDLDRVQIAAPDGAWSFTVASAAEQWRVETALRWTHGRARAQRMGAATHETSMTDDAMHELPLTLTLEVARFEISLGDLAALTPGELLSSGVPLDGSVLVRAGDRAVARGELVDIEGETGVRILELLGDAASE